MVHTRGSIPIEMSPTQPTVVHCCPPASQCLLSTHPGGGGERRGEGLYSESYIRGSSQSLKVLIVGPIDTGTELRSFHIEDSCVHKTRCWYVSHLAANQPLTPRLSFHSEVSSPGRPGDCYGSRWVTCLSLSLRDSELVSPPRGLPRGFKILNLHPLLLPPPQPLLLLLLLLFHTPSMLSTVCSETAIVPLLQSIPVDTAQETDMTFILMFPPLRFSFSLSSLLSHP